MNTQKAKLIESVQTPSGIQTGIVARQEDENWVVRIGWTEITASKAASCLLEPRIGDKVAIYTDQSTSFILHILSRTDKEAPRKFTLGQDAALVAQAGGVSIVAGKGIDAVTPGQVNLVSGRLTITSREADSAVSNWRSRSETVEIDSASLKLKSVAVEMKADRLVERIKNCFRWVEELDQLKAGQLFYDVKNVLAMRGKHSVVTAEEELKLDGERIHMG